MHIDEQGLGGVSGSGGVCAVRLCKALRAFLSLGRVLYGVGVYLGSGRLRKAQGGILGQGHMGARTGVHRRAQARTGVHRRAQACTGVHRRAQDKASL